MIRDRLSGGPAFADEKDNYPLPLIARFVDMALPVILSGDSYVLSEMSIPRDLTSAEDSTGYYVTLNPPSAAGVLGITTVTDDNGDYYVQDKAMAQSFKTLRASNKNAAILFQNKLRFNRTPSTTVSVTYVPLVSQMADNDQIVMGDQSSELELYNVIVKTIIQTDRWRADKTNNDLTDPQ